VNRILMSGASGLLGGALLPSLEAAGVDVVCLVRGAARNAGQLAWNPMGELAPSAVSGFDSVIHLAGESVVGRWTAAKRQAIRESRVQGTKTLAGALARTDRKPRVFICASAIGFYGDRGDEFLTEESPAGSGFLAQVCQEWEAASRIATDAGIRTVNVRIGLVLSTKGGALAKMLPVFRMGAGGRLASGQQWWSWIHVDDIVGAIHHILRTDALSGPVNLVAPNPARNEDFTKMLASVLHRPALFPVPGFALGLAFGRLAAAEMFLSSTRVQPAKLEASAYTFRFNDLQSALESLIRPGTA